MATYKSLEGVYSCRGNIIAWVVERDDVKGLQDLSEIIKSVGQETYLSGHERSYMEKDVIIFYTTVEEADTLKSI